MINKLEELEQEINDRGIVLLHLVPLEPLRGCYVNDKDTAVINISPKLTAKEQVAVAAEELGHHDTNGGNQLTACASEYERNELRALQKAIERLVPLDTLGNLYFKHKGNPFAIADALSISAIFLSKAIQRYTDKYGIETQTRQTAFFADAFGEDKTERHLTECRKTLSYIVVPEKWCVA